MADDVAFLSATRLLTLYHSKDISPVEVIDETLRRLDRYEGALNAFVLYDPDEAISQARAAEARWQKGKPKVSSTGSRRDQSHGVDPRLAAVIGLAHHQPQSAMGRGFTGRSAAAGGRGSVLWQDDRA